MSLPRSSQIVAVSKSKKGAVDIKPVYEGLFEKDTFIDRIEKYLTNGLVTGHKILDQYKMLEQAQELDTSERIEFADLTIKEKVDQLMVVVRRHYVLDKKGKFVSLNPKRYAMIENKSAKTDAPAGEVATSGQGS